MYQLLPYLKRIRTATRRTRPGLPSTLDGTAVERAIATAAGRPCRGFRYRLISRSPTGKETYRLVATLDNGEAYPAVYHMSPFVRHAPSQLAAAINSAIETFTMTEGLVLSATGTSSLGRFAPEVLFSESTSHALHYIVEEIVGAVPEGDSLIAVARELPSLHRGLAEWAEFTEPRLASRHEQYFEEVAATIKAVIVDVAASGNRAAQVLADRWPAVVDLHSVLADHDPQPIHGDLHRWNVFVLEPPGSGIKVIDWDAVVWGDPHVDLATLLMEEDAGLQQEALDGFVAASDNGDDPAVAKETYLQARLHVALLWSCFFATDRRRTRQARAMKRYLAEAARLLELLA